MRDSRALPPASPQVITRLRKGSDIITGGALERLEAEVEWYRELSAKDRSWVGLVARAGISAFIDWYEKPVSEGLAAHGLFRAAPRELTRSISLPAALELIRLVIEVVETQSAPLVESADRAPLREAVLIYSRDVAFEAAGVYARAAESRGSWDARLEALIIDSLARGAHDSTLRSRFTALGWPPNQGGVALIGSIDARAGEAAVFEFRRACRKISPTCLIGVNGEQLVCVLGGEGDIERQAARVVKLFGHGSVVVGPVVKEITDLSRSMRAALAGYLACAAWGGKEVPIQSEDLLPERMLNGDPLARHTLLTDIYRPLAAQGESTFTTLREYLTQGGSLEGAARTLYVHPNTVRYRLRSIAQKIGWDPTDPRDAFVLQIAISVGLMSDSQAQHTGM